MAAVVHCVRLQNLALSFKFGEIARPQRFSLEPADGAEAAAGRADEVARVHCVLREAVVEEDGGLGVAAPAPLARRLYFVAVPCDPTAVRMEGLRGDGGRPGG